MANDWQAGWQDVWQEYDRTKWETVNPDRIVDGRREVLTVSEAVNFHEYIREEFKNASSAQAKQIRQKTIEASEIYGDKVHQIRGNGDCGVTSFGVGLLYHIVESNNLSLCERLINLIMWLKDIDAPLAKEIQDNVLPGLMGFAGEISDRYLQEALLNNDAFMLAFSKVLRCIAYQSIPRVMRQELEENQMNPIEYAKMLIPKDFGKNISAEGYMALARIFNVNIHMIDTTGNAGFDLAKQYHPTIKEDEHKQVVADIVTVRQPGHFINIVPDKQRQLAHRLLPSNCKTLKQKEPEQRAPAAVFKLRDRAVVLDRSRVDSTNQKHKVTVQNEDGSNSSICSVVAAISILSAVAFMCFNALSNLFNGK